MTRIIVPQRRIWTRQPQRPVGVDWSNPLMAGLVLASEPLSLLVLGTNGAPIGKWATNAIETSSPVAIAVDQDLGLCINSTHDFADLTGTTATVSDDSSITFVSVFKTSTFDQARSYLTRGADGAGSGWSFRINTNTSKLVEAGIVLTSGGTVGYTATSTTTVDGKAVVAAATYDKADKYLRLYINGKLEASVSTGKTGMRSSTLGIRIGGSHAASGASLGGYSYGKVGPQLVWNRALSASEIARISANVRLGFKPRTRRTIIDLGASGGLSITATLGLADATAFSANVDLQRTISASLASAAAAGFSANIDLQRNVSAARGDASAFGYLAGVDLRRSIIAALGAAVASGYDATVNLAGALNIPTSLGVAQASGRQANVNLSFDLSATPGSAAAIGLSASISNEEAPFTQAQLDYLLAYMQEHLMIPTSEEIAAAVLAAMQASPPPVDVHKTRGYPLVGDGTEADPWRREGVEP